MDVDAFNKRWAGLEGGAERANYVLFLSELCDVLGLPRPEPAGTTTDKNDYVFERAVRRPDGSSGRIDLYKRDGFVLEAKQSRQGERTRAGAANDKFLGQLSLGLTPEIEPAQRGRRSANRNWDVLMVNARAQAEDYARCLPQDHGWPPFIIVCDVGHSIEVFADFRRMGKYEQFPDRQSYRIFMEDLRDEKVRARLKAIWTDPHSLDPARQAAKTTREIAVRLAAVSKALEAKGAAPEDVAHFLMRCIFTMFAEDWKLLPEDSFKGLLARCVKDPRHFPERLKELWKAMDRGGFSHAIDAEVRHFNGGLFSSTTVFELPSEEIGELLAAASADWREVEPAIFGTLLEQALDPAERRRLGAHYTPRAYVERLVTATILEPLRDDWRLVLSAAEERRAANDMDGARLLVAKFHRDLCSTRVLDPACGTGNFLYVSLELMKRLEGEVLEALVDLGGEEALRGLQGHTVDPHQFLGLELNPRAAAIAELVLWIGYLQQHLKMKGAAPDDPILRQFKNINFGKPGGYDAVLTWDNWPVPNIVEGRETYPNARRPDWPEAEFIVGNPPFIGGKDVRSRLGNGYAETVWKTHSHINPSADFVMYWWDRAADLLTCKGAKLRRFGLVTTNSITQEFSRRAIRKRMDAKAPISLLMAIPDHPWTRADRDAAAVRIAMTVTAAGGQDGVLHEVVAEADLDSDEPRIELQTRKGRINADLSVGTDVTAATPLFANAAICSPGVKLHGSGFIVTPTEAEHLGLGRRPGLERHIRPYRNGRDLTANSRNVMVIDLFGLTDAEARERYPEVYQHLLATVKPEREREFARSRTKDAEAYARLWWLFGKPRQELRPALAGLDRYIVTVETMRHRVFMFLGADTTPDNMLFALGSADAWHLAALSSRPHVAFAIAAGGWLGMGNDPRYSKTRTFDPFPFPDPSEALKVQLRAAGEELDAFRKARQTEHPRLTLTQMYNVREALRAGRALTQAEDQIKQDGLILILNELHDRIDQLTLEAYDWPHNLSDEAILERLVALNRTRAEEERRGHVRWLRPDYQKPRAGVIDIAPVTGDLDLAREAVASAKPLFPKDLVEQFGQVASALAWLSAPTTAAQLAATFRQGKKVERKIADILLAMARTGAASSRDGLTFEARRAA
ncbi:MAG: type IIL restriction-modification enzyme MmeI [Alphaproteobacteria bacterium]|nr:type IIL restriction-modification enzyme MmeI [Alphaproteobacteria bacterium]